jgi:mono/diheme cytochrome c family protein
MQDGVEADGMPFPVTETVLQRGQERYNIYCSPCHSRVGNGKGRIVERGYYQATSFHSDRLRRAPLGHFFSVITNGYGAMPDYAAQLSPEDRWAVAAYIRALQLSQSATQQDVPAGTTVSPIDSVTEQSGLSAHFLDSWTGSPVQAISAPSEPSRAGATPSSAGLQASSSGANGEHQAAVPAQVAAKEAKGDVGKGKKIYMENCAVCHQPTRTGMPPIFPSLLGIVDRVGETRVRTVARTGIPDAKPPMPPHPNLTDENITDLIAFLRSK